MTSGVGALFGGANNGRLRSSYHRAKRNTRAKPNGGYKSDGKKGRVAELFAEGLTSKQIAERLGITVPNVCTYLGRIRKDLGWQAV